MNTKVNLAGVELKNPVMVASGTFGSGAEYSEVVYLNSLGAVVTKGVDRVQWRCRDHRRHAQCHRTSESGHGSFFKESFAVP